MKQETTVHRWTTKSEYFDIENGEEITRQIALKNYYILKKTKNVKINEYKGTITWTCECRRKNQLKFW